MPNYHERFERMERITAINVELFSDEERPDIIAPEIDECDDEIVEEEEEEDE
jgi:hypothetical protein